MSRRLYFILLVIFTLNYMAYGYINVEPLYLDKRIDGQGAYQEFTLTNTTNKTLRYRIYSEKESDKNDMSQWMDFYPRSLTLRSGESKKIKLLVTAPNDEKKGEYIAFLGIKEIPIPLLESTSAVDLFTNLKIELAGYIGDLKPQVVLNNIRIDKNNKISGTIENIGQIRTKVELYLVDKKNNKKFIGSYRLFVGDKKNLENKKNLYIKNFDVKEIIGLDRNGNEILKEKIKREK